MWSFALLLLSCLTACNALKTDTLKKTYAYSSEYEIILDDEPIKNNSLVHAACISDEYRKEINCSIALASFPDAKTVKELGCQSSYHVVGTSRNISKQFQLKKLFGNYVAFVWSDQDVNDITKEQLVLSVINMEDCQRSDYEFKTQIDDFHIISYDNSFDVFYHDDNLCDKVLCGQTFDWRGRLLIGPVPSYLPTSYFNNNSHVCSVANDSTAKGHYVVTPYSFNLVSAIYGKKLQMGILPLDARISTYDCHEEYLGYCWITQNKRIINCEQFNSHGRRILSTGENVDYEPGMWLSMRNFGASELLIVNNECESFDTCVGNNTEKVKFHVLKKLPDSNAFNMHVIQGLDCNDVDDIRSEVTKKDDGRYCVTLACKATNLLTSNTKDPSKGVLSVKFLSTCFK